MRVITALLVAPLFPALIVAMIAAIMSGGFESSGPADVVISCLMAGYATVIVFGLPLSFLWKRLGFNGVLGGITLGVVSAICMTMLVACLMLYMSRSGQGSVLRGLAGLLVIACPIGAIGGLAFWWFGLKSPGNRLERDVG